MRGAERVIGRLSATSTVTPNSRTDMTFKKAA